MKTLKLLFAAIFCIVFNSTDSFGEIKTNPIYSDEQIQILENASKSPYFLIADQLKYLYPKTFIISGFDSLTQNIVLSFITSSSKRNYLKYFQNNLLANADLENVIALDYAYSGLYISSIKHYEKALGLIDANKSENNTSIIHKNLAHLYYSQNDLIRASIHNELLIKIAKKDLNNQLLISSLIFKTNILLRKGEIKQAEQMILKNVLLISNGSDGKKKEQACYLQLGKIYLLAKRYTEAKWFFIQSLTLSNQLNLKAQKIESLLLLAKVKSLIKDYSLASADLKLVRNLLQNGYSIYQDDYNLQLAQTNSYLR